MYHETYQSPFSWRYGSGAMRRIFSERHKYELWRKLWVALARAQYHAGLVNKHELTDLLKHQTVIDIDRILEMEKETDDNLFAAIKEYAEKAKIGGGKIHFGATSMDIVDNTQVIQIKEGLLLLRPKIGMLLKAFANQIEKYADVPCIGFTHLQPADPTTVGYRLAFYAQSLLGDAEFLDQTIGKMQGKGLKGAVGTSANYIQLLKSSKTALRRLEVDVMKEVGLAPALITSQTYDRKQDYLVLTALSNIAGSLAKFAADVRILQSPQFGEWNEPFAKKQVGSSAEPFKKNPHLSERICSLARYVTHLPPLGLENAMHSYLEKTFDDSANRRSIIPEAFLATDEIIDTSLRIVKGMSFNRSRIAQNLEQYAPFAASESILMKMVALGADSHEIHDLLKRITLKSWDAITNGHPNPMKQLLYQDTIIAQFLHRKDLDDAFEVKQHIGDAPQRARKLAKLLGE